MPNYYSTNSKPRQTRHFNPWPIICLIAIIIIIFLNWPAHDSNQPSTTPPKPTNQSISLTYKIDYSLSTQIEPLLTKYQTDNPNIRLRLNDRDTSAKPDISFSTDTSTKDKTLINQNIFSAQFNFIPEKLNTTFPKTNFIISASYNNTNQTAKNLADYLTQKLKLKTKTQTNLFAVGDIMLSRHVYTITSGTGNYDYPFLKTYQQIKSADISFANFEAPIFNQGLPVTEGMSFKVEPKMTSGIKFSGFDILSLANNHFGNQGQAGMLYTTKYLKKSNINYCGGGKDDKEAYAPAYITRNNLKFAFLCYTDQRIDPRIAGPNKPGNAMMYFPKLKEGIALAKKNADIVIVSMHSGTEYTPDPYINQIKFAHSAINYGANIVIGHHPHVVEAIEIYKGRPILYSLGNFIFDQMWSTETTQGITANITFTDKEISKIDILPIKIHNYAQPYFLGNNSESNQIINRIIKASEKL